MPTARDHSFNVRAHEEHLIFRYSSWGFWSHSIYLTYICSWCCLVYAFLMYYMYLSFVCLYFCMFISYCGIENRGQLGSVGSLLPQCRTQGLNSGPRLISKCLQLLSHLPGTVWGYFSGTCSECLISSLLCDQFSSALWFHYQVMSATAHQTTNISTFIPTARSSELNHFSIHNWQSMALTNP